MDKSAIEIKNSPHPHQIESLRIDRSKGRVRGNFNAVGFIDNDTKATIFYIPSFDISGHGSSFEEAKTMAFDTLDDLLTSILSMSADNIHQTLKELGWEKNPLFNKQYSKAFVDAEGQLQGFNVKEDSLTTLGLITA